MTCEDCTPAASSPASRTLTDTGLPTTVYTPRCSCPPFTTDSYRPDWPSSPPQPPPHCGKPPTHTSRHSKTSATQQDSLPNHAHLNRPTQNLTQNSGFAGSSLASVRNEFAGSMMNSVALGLARTFLHF